MANTSFRVPYLEKYLEEQGQKHTYISYDQGARLFQMNYWAFVRLVKEANANWTLRKTAMVDLEKLEQYIKENYRLEKVYRKESERDVVMRRKQLSNIEEMLGNKRKKYVRYDEGAQLFSMGLHSFQQLAKDAGAVYKIKNIVLVNVDEVEEFIRTFKVEE